MQDNFKEIYRELKNELDNLEKELEEKEDFLASMDDEYTRRYKQIGLNKDAREKINAKIEDKKLIDIRNGQQVCKSHIEKIKASIERYENEIAECIQDSEGVDAEISFVIDETQELLEDASAVILKAQRDMLQGYDVEEDNDAYPSHLSVSVNNRWNTVKSETHKVLEKEHYTDKAKTLGVIKAMEAQISRPASEFEEQEVTDFCKVYELMMNPEAVATKRIQAAQDVIAFLLQRNIVEPSKQTSLLKRLLDHYKIYTKL